MINKYNYKYYNLLYSTKCFIIEILNVIFYFLYTNFKHLCGFTNNFTHDKNDLIIFCSYGYMPGNIKWNFNIDDGIGGSEYCIIKLAETMAKDKKVIVYCDCLSNYVNNNVQYIKTNLFDYSIYYENIILWRHPFIEWFLNYKNLILWIHDASLLPVLDVLYNMKILPYFINPQIKIVVPSQFMYEELIKYVFYKKIYKINHGFQKYDKKKEALTRNKNTFIWHVNINRGLDILLNNFNSILDRFPDSIIFICGDRFAYNKQNHFINNELILKYEKNIVYTNKLTHDKILELLNKCDFFCYTCSVQESFSLCTWEAALNGCIPIVYDIGAICEIKNVGGIVIKNKNSELFIETLLNLMQNEERKEQIRNNIITSITEKVKYRWDEVKVIWYEKVF